MEAVIRLFSIPDRIEEYGRFDAQVFVTEWIKPDFLNVVFVNSDNHGRNTAFLKWDGHIELSPIYDFSPMKADPEGVIRLTRWGDLASGGKFDWYHIVATTEAYLQSIAPIYAAATEQIMNFPALGFVYFDLKLETWGLL